MYQHQRIAQSREAFDQAMRRARLQHGAQLDTGSIAEQFVPYFHGQRVEVTTTYGEGPDFVRTGTVSISTGRKPILLLIHRSNSYGSWDTLSARDRITGVQYSKGGKYYPAPAAVSA